MLRTNFIRNIPRPKKDYSHLLKITGFNNYTDEVLARLKDIGYDVIKDYNVVIWYNNRKMFHREDGPAIEYINGYKAWYFNGESHREDGPAIERDNGDKLWYFNGKKYTEEGYINILKKNLRLRSS